MWVRERHQRYVQEHLPLLDRAPMAWRLVARAQRTLRILDWPYRSHGVLRSLSTTTPRCGRPTTRSVLPVLLLMLTMLSPASRPAYTEENPRKFGVYYGERLDPQLSAFDVLVLDADSGLDLARIRKRAKARQLILGYLALCEVDPSRSYARKTRQARLLLHESRYWPRSFYIDIRRPEWQRMVLDEIVPSILKAGFDGLFLDTIDDAPWLETNANSTCCLRANENPRPLRYLIFRGSIPHPMQSLCTLRNHCRQWPRNTRYQADATPYLGRTCTGWIAPALPGALIRSPRRHARAAPVELRARALAR